MNVTTEINSKRNSMGGSGSSRQAYLSANRSLNLSSAGNNINAAAPKLVTAIPTVLSAEDSVGLFGPENKFIQLDLDIKSGSYEDREVVENTYFPVRQSSEQELFNDYYSADMDFLLDTERVNTYEPARSSTDLSNYGRPVISVELFNLKTGNRFIDSWLDIQMYGPDKRPVESDKIYTDVGSDIYIGFHARNTRRLPYSIRVEVGAEFLEYSSLNSAQKELFV